MGRAGAEGAGSTSVDIGPAARVASDVDSLSGPPAGRAGIAWRLLPPVVVFLLMRLVFSLSTGSDLTSMVPETWARYDSGNYEAIATEGYYWDSCEERGLPEQGDVCTDVAWYPLYPALVRLAMEVTGASVSAAGIAIAQAAQLGVLLLLWGAFLGPKPSGRGIALLVMAGFFPGGVYYLAEFPVSLLCLLLLVQVWCFSRRRWWWGAAAAAGAGLCYPLAIALVPASMVWVAVAEWPAPSDRRRWMPVAGRAAGVGAIVSLGTLGVMALHEVQLGRALASIDAQRQVFHSALRNPLAQWWEVVGTRSTWLQWASPEVADLLAWQTLLVATLLVVALVVTVRAGQRARPHGWGLAVMLVLLWLLPLANQFQTGLYRREATLVPLVILLRRAPTPLVVALAAASVAVWWPVADAFFRSVLI